MSLWLTIIIYSLFLLLSRTGKFIILYNALMTSGILITNLILLRNVLFIYSYMTVDASGCFHWPFESDSVNYDTTKCDICS